VDCVSVELARVPPEATFHFMGIVKGSIQINILDFLSGCSVKCVVPHIYLLTKSIQQFLIFPGPLPVSGTHTAQQPQQCCRAVGVLCGRAGEGTENRDLNIHLHNLHYSPK